MEKTLKDLNTDYLDMLLIHYPMAYKVGCGKNATHCKVQGTYCVRNHGLKTLMYTNVWICFDVTCLSVYSYRQKTHILSDDVKFEN